MNTDEMPVGLLVDGLACAFFNYWYGKDSGLTPDGAAGILRKNTANLSPGELDALKSSGISDPEQAASAVLSFAGKNGIAVLTIPCFTGRVETVCSCRPLARSVTSHDAYNAWACLLTVPGTPEPEVLSRLIGALQTVLPPDFDYFGRFVRLSPAAEQEEGDEYAVAFAVDARYYAHVVAKDPEEALEKGQAEWMDADIGDLEDTDAKPIHVETPDGRYLEPSQVEGGA